jgi:sugar lactone lactonase YvrE
MSKVLNAELAVKLNCNLGEGPFWDSKKQELYFVDISNKQVLIFAPSSNSVEAITFDQEIGAVLLDQNSELIVAARDGLYAATRDGDLKTLLAPIDFGDSSIRCNDAKCDANGRIWVGTMAFDFKQGAASLYSFDSENLKEILSDLTIANGLGWSPDQKTMYFIDSLTSRVDSFDFDLASGAISNRQPFVTFSDPGVIPDGMTTDEDGGIWVALFGGSAVRRFDSAGKLTHTVSVPATQVTSCCFGGPDMSELYITTAQYAMDAEALSKDPLAGSLFRVQTTFKGSKSNRYGASTS